MITNLSCIARASLIATLAVTAPAALTAQTVDYHHAEQLLTWNAMRHVTGDQVSPTWYRDSTRFWYRVMTARGPEFVTVNGATGARSLLFDNGRLAAALSLAADTAVVGSMLPFTTVSLENEGRDEGRIRVKLGARGFSCSLTTYVCAKADTLPPRTRYVRSPDEQWDAFASGNNLWIRKVGSADSIQLTTDGIDGYAYGVGSPLPTQIRRKLPSVPQVTWSPDSKRLVVPRIDERGVGKFVLYSSTTSRPTYYVYPYALPGDSIVQTYVNYDDRHRDAHEQADRGSATTADVVLRVRREDGAVEPVVGSHLLHPGGPRTEARAVDGGGRERQRALPDHR